MKRRGILLLAAADVAALLSTEAGPVQPPPGTQQQSSFNQTDLSVTVKPRNVYHGVDAELNQASAARTFNEFLDGTAAVSNGYQEKNLPKRAAALAAEIEQSQPDVVVLQETLMVRKDTPADGPAGEVSLDHLQILLDELQARGSHYTPVAQSLNWDIEVPAALGFYLRHTNRIVTLIRTDEGSGLEVPGTSSGHLKIVWVEAP
jgi:hypothetical protein